MSKSIPDRWIPYKACGKVIEGTRIVCFKVPLRKGVQEHNKAIKEIWDIKTLLNKFPNLGAVVDLTNTARYYNPGELREAGVLHKKILMPGRVIPPENKVIQFMDTIDEFLGKDCDILIGVHCTHGLNRTGYMVCRYMRDRLGIQADDAISRFEKARGYKIERENYVADLLGKMAPPPDVGKQNTMIKPINDHDQEDDVSKPRHNKRWGFNNRSGHDNWRKRDNQDGGSGYGNRWSNDNQSKDVNSSGRDNESGYTNRSGSGNQYDKRSLQYRSPLDQCDDMEHQDQEEYNEYRKRFKYNPYSRNRNRNNSNDTPTSGRSSSKWDMSGASHRPR
ncbi:RNA/RNP complex-1-interacting phosphatase [Cydia pomonella]|uniref:RNA/RNP complex-1-interacting phosphatase n=1 Tax=Cydia pomonella TaxID=82600 RepID=UPI002ADD4AF2|nr:RNA/RNP complex-1-interacting phosphatase [Cydia pomonella]